MRIAYGDLIGGLSGDMFVGALLDLGLPLSTLKSELKKIPTLEYRLAARKKAVHGIRATQFRVTCPPQRSERAWLKIRDLIERSRLHPDVKLTGIEIFTRLATAEGKIHGVSPDRVHFHEVGATDSIVDVMAAAIGCRELEIDAIHFSPVPLGRGVTRSRHGPLPLPGPATLELLKGIPVQGISIEGETVTPTGAAIMSALARGFGNQPPMTVAKIGYGAGEKEFLDRPNVFRLIVGSNETGLHQEEMLVMETNIDDMNPQLYDHVMDRLFTAGARDVFLSPVQMKKNRPGTLLTIICEAPRRRALEKVVFEETSTIGVRSYPVSRTILKRESKKLKTRFGEVTVKIIEQPDGSKRAAPEYDDLKHIAVAKNIPLGKLHDEIMRILGK